jgi:hypothetical protein
MMGALALGVLWVNTLLIALDAWRRRAALSRRLAALRASRASGALVEAEILEGRGPGGAFAERSVRQVGRALTVEGPPRILFTDASASGEVFGGRAKVGGEELEIVPAAEVELWCSPSPEARGDLSEFEAAWSRASTFKGFSTVLSRTAGKGARVWLWLEPSAGATRSVRLVSTDDPTLVVGRARRPLAVLVLVALAGAAAVTALAAWPPVFGLVSTLGGALALVFFLAIQPLGTAARDRARLPSEGHVGGVWQRPG